LVAAYAAAAEVRRRGVDALVVDVEGDSGRLGLAVELAEHMGARYVRLEEVTPGAVEEVVRAGRTGPSGPVAGG
jgi:Mg-chelatase subunit ChlD